MNFLGWIDHDGDREEAILRALGAAKGNDARDELGLGTIRDSFADLFFPGISTIQQRVRYFLFVQWCCELAASQGEADRIVARLRANEETLIGSLKHLGEGRGVIGILSQEALERMPSEIYWNGLAVLGMRRIRGGRSRWARQVAVSRRAARESNLLDEGRKPAVDLGFDADRPDPPEGFPNIDDLDFALTQEERDFLRSRLSAACIDGDRLGHRYNLFGTFSRHRRATRAAWLWDHPRVGTLKPEVRDMVMLAAAFARVMHGAAILYNVCVARLLPPTPDATRLVAQHSKAFTDWAGALGAADVDLLARRLPEIPRLGALTRHRVDERTLGFVRRWTELAPCGADLLDHAGALALVGDREVYLKAGGGTSRIRFSKQRERWKGDSGSQMMDFRWFRARSCLNDLAAKPSA
ncbi:hypothetical protein E2E30_03100 [Sphingomonas sp. AAP5]|uniref:DUF6361 family protein n=1 Tax=Sphingomonas sp. AAP5 TaxID=1523415 RepID=UPI00105743A9|nr:DUF6361 family protein [Sphingomonas sp. AAP5]QBM74855.1 hypothetical protein E2E30_03100 [Sphingomonas sp. AAP5]